jgi:hypothetical protein
MKNSIYLRRKCKIFIAPGNNTLSDNHLINLLANIEVLGYTFSEELLKVIRSLSEKELKIFYTELITNIKEMLGASVEYKPMYPNFPDQVKNANESELYTNAFWHYLGDWFGIRILPNYEKQKREKLKDSKNLKVIALGTIDDFNSIFTSLLSAKTSISESDKKDVEWFIKTYDNTIKELLPEEIPLKENVGLLIGYLIINFIECNELINKYVKTATDVLRIATALSGGDISLAENTKFKSFSKKIRRLLLQTLENGSNITEDMLRYQNRWKRLGERLHPFEYKNKYPKCYDAFDTIRNDRPFATFNSKVEMGLLEKDTVAVTKLLKTRPGEFARKLDKLIRDTEDATYITDEFKSISQSVSTPVLLQLICHFKNRNSPKELRSFFPKGNVATVKAIDDKLPPIGTTICNSIIENCELVLIERFKKYKPLGKVYLDNELRNYMVPFALRSASKALKTIARCSRVRLPDGDTIRFFIYWKDGENRSDLDLSALGLGDDSRFKEVIAYYNLKSLGGYHSGDITSAPDGASEFIDIEVSKFLKAGIRYVVMCVNSFTEQKYCDLPICIAGFMVRKFPNSGEIYEPLTVDNKFDLTSNTKIAIPLILDLKERIVIWTDLSLKSNPSTCNNVHNNISSISIINKSLTTMVKPNLYDLFSLHIQARGEKVFDKNDADFIFSVSEGVKPTDLDIIISEFL